MILNNFWTKIFGIFGIALDKKNHDFRTKTKDFHFSFVNDSIVTSIYSTVEDDDLIAFSPMFREYCGLQRQNKYIISPVKQNEY